MDNWVSTKDRLPEDEQEVIAGNINWRYVFSDVMFMGEYEYENIDLDIHIKRQPAFIIRENANTGGRAGYLQVNLKEKYKLWSRGFECFPTHWIPQLKPPKDNG